MIDPNCKTGKECFRRDHIRLKEVERMALNVMSGLAYIQQFVPICACNDIHKIGERIGSALQEIHAVDRALEICSEDDDITKYHEEHDREIKESATGECRWNEVLDYARGYTHKKTQKGTK